MKIKDFPYEDFDGIYCNGDESDAYKNNNFIKTFLVEKKSFVNEQASFEDLSNAINSVYKHLSEQNGAKDKSFAEAIKGIKNQDQILVLNHALWLWCFPNSRKTHYELGANTLKDKKEKLNGYTDISAKSIAGAGSGYVQTKTNGVRFIVYIFKECYNLQLQEKTQDEAHEIHADEESLMPEQALKVTERTIIKNKIIDLCRAKKYDNEKFSVPDGVKNLLLHLCKPDEYEPIASTADKERIIKKCEEIGCVTNGNDDDTKLKSLREDNFIKSIIGANDTFYSNHFPLLWKGENVNSTLSRVQLLEYKQAMVLYGPPGTGKTYTAMELAKEILVRSVMKSYKKASDKQKCKDCIREIINAENATEKLCDKDNILSKYIYYLQFHINYNYEDFIAGQTMGKEGIETKEGFIFNIIKKAKEDSSMPYIVILDEMNRVDVSRVFGELFTAIEKRNTDVRLTLKKNVGKSEGKEEGTKDNEEEYLVLNVPDNVYFIGTMNEIDFSLERIDFALRRRFIWEKHDYSEDSLESIINSRLENIADDKNVNVDDFITCCSAVNKLIDKEDSLGPDYHIGHAFFAEVAEIYKNLKESSPGANNWKQARNILWEISILPTLDAYCGSMDKKEKEAFIENCKKAYNGNSSDLDSEEYEVEEYNS